MLKSSAYVQKSEELSWVNGGVGGGGETWRMGEA
jgi:hypothetical protein